MFQPVSTNKVALLCFVTSSLASPIGWRKVLSLFFSQHSWREERKQRKWRKRGSSLLRRVREVFEPHFLRFPHFYLSPLSFNINNSPLHNILIKDDFLVISCSTDSLLLSFFFSQHGTTPLHYAAANGRTLTCELLCMAGANPHAYNWVRELNKIQQFFCLFLFHFPSFPAGGMLKFRWFDEDCPRLFRGILKDERIFKIQRSPATVEQELKTKLL